MNPRHTGWLLLLPLALAHAQSGVRRSAPERAAEFWTETTTAAQHALKANRLDEAVTLSEAAITQARAFGPRDTHLARSLVLRAEICLWEKRNDRAEALFRDAVAATEVAVGPRSRELVYPLSSLANFYYYVAPHRDRVAGLFERIVDIAEHAPDRDEHEVLLWSRNLAQLYTELGEFRRAEPLYQRTVALAARIEPQYATHEMLGMAEFYRQWRHFDRAEHLAREALAVREHSLTAAPDDVDAKLDVVVALDELATIQLGANQLATAESNAVRALTLAESFMSREQPDLRPRIAALAIVYRAEHKLDLAATLYRRLLALTEKNLGAKCGEMATVLSDYALVLRESNEAGEAAAVETRAETIKRQLAGSL